MAKSGVGARSRVLTNAGPGCHPSREGGVLEPSRSGALLRRKSARSTVEWWIWGGLHGGLLLGLAVEVDGLRAAPARSSCRAPRGREVPRQILEHGGLARDRRRGCRGSAHRSAPRAWARSRPPRCRRCPRNGRGCPACAAMFSACWREPLVRISLRPGQLCDRLAQRRVGIQRASGRSRGRIRGNRPARWRARPSAPQRRAVAAGSNTSAARAPRCRPARNFRQEQRDALVDLRP